MADYELIYPGGALPLDAVDGTEMPAGLAIGSLLGTTGRTTFDPGYGNTASCKSAITFIDGDAGILRYRGYPIDQLAKSSTFLETAYLLIYGELPSATELDNFSDRIAKHTLLHEDLKGFFNGFRHDAHPMAVLNSAVSALGTFYQDSLDPFDPEHVEVSTIRLLAKVPTSTQPGFYLSSLGGAARLAVCIVHDCSRNLISSRRPLLSSSMMLVKRGSSHTLPPPIET